MESYHDKIEKEFQNNTKSTQTESLSQKVRSFGTQTRKALQKDCCVQLTPETSDISTIKLGSHWALKGDKTCEIPQSY